MGYVDRVLQPGETVHYTARLTRASYIPGGVALVLALLVYLLTSNVNPRWLGIVAALLILAWALYSLGTTWFRQWTTEIAVTDRRVIIKRGFIRRATTEINNEKIESVDVRQTILGRLLGYGTITIRGTGTGLEPIDNIDNPLQFRSRLTATAR